MICDWTYLGEKVVREKEYLSAMVAYGADVVGFVGVVRVFEALKVVLSRWQWVMVLLRRWVLIECFQQLDEATGSSSGRVSRRSTWPDVPALSHEPQVFDIAKSSLPKDTGPHMRSPAPALELSTFGNFVYCMPACTCYLHFVSLTPLRAAEAAL